MKEFHSVLFIGFGLIGGSIARGLRASCPGIRIAAWARHREKLEPALQDGTLDLIAQSMDSEVQNADLIFLCAPTLSNLENLRSIAPLVPEDTLLTDVGSVKGDIQRCAQEAGVASHFLGGHPMTGRELSGYAAADAQILENAYYILTPSEQTDPEFTEAFTEVVHSLKSIPLRSDPFYHDYATAAISHLPHLIAAELVRTVKHSDNEEQFMYTIAAGGFKDITRIASSDPAMWESICRSNTENIRALLNTYVEGMQRIDRELAEGRFEEIHRLFEESGAYRAGMADRRRGTMPRDHRLFVDIPDEKGQIAAVAVLLAAADINIKNIGITHNREQAEGALYIAFDTEGGRDAAIPVLEKEGYRVILK